MDTIHSGKDVVECVALLPVPAIDMLPIHLEEQTRVHGIGADSPCHGSDGHAGPVDWKKARDEPHSDAALYGPVDWKKAREEPRGDAA